MNPVDDEDKKMRIGHRARMMQRCFDDKLVDYEMLEYALSLVIPRCDVRKPARRLLEKFGSLYGVLAASPQDMMTVKGIGPRVASCLKNTRNMMMCAFQQNFSNTPVFRDVTALYNYCRLLVGGKLVEELHVLYLGADMRLLGDERHSIGTINKSSIYMREIVHHAMNHGARFILLLHNHPTPMMSFSEIDTEITQGIMQMIHGMELDLYDHLLVSGNIVYSARNMNMLN